MTPSGWGVRGVLGLLWQVPSCNLGLEALFQGARNDSGKSKFGVFPCQSRARDTKGRSRGELSPNSKATDPGLQLVAVVSEDGRSTRSKQGPGQGGALQPPVDTGTWSCHSD